MGVINFKPTEDLILPPFDFIPVANWRILGIMKGNKIEVIIARFQRFVIHNITPKEFHALNQNKETREYPYRYINNALPCQVCRGKGRVDWIQKTRSSPPRSISNHDSSHKYYRRDTNPNSIKRLKPYPSVNDLLEMYGSCPKVTDGFEICGKCLGTGIYYFNTTTKSSLAYFDYSLDKKSLNYFPKEANADTPTKSNDIK